MNSNSINVPKKKELSHPKYRPDIDGLRALAVLSIVGFHASPFRVPGGFIGVDIFFVISGFLISTIIFENLEHNRFSFIEFYSRRIKRIFPALLLVLTASLAMGWFVLFSDEFKQLGKHIAGGAGFLANLVFWSESGYFDTAGHTKPLLHLWSLGIEEQFYIVWPLLLWFTWRQRLNLLTITITVAVISFALNIRGVGDDAVAVFYAPQTRFWELLVGSILAYTLLYMQNIFVGFRYKLDRLLSVIIYAQTPTEKGVALRTMYSLSPVPLCLP
ncbi:MAG: acyltransferase [Candidatus Electrothrix sp. AR4]|nr:acyltransferase [Candidatus Electrothrix sp. AR4]